MILKCEELGALIKEVFFCGACLALTFSASGVLRHKTWEESSTLDQVDPCLLFAPYDPIFLWAKVSNKVKNRVQDGVGCFCHKANCSWVCFQNPSKINWKEPRCLRENKTGCEHQTCQLKMLIKERRAQCGEYRAIALSCSFLHVFEEGIYWGTWLLSIWRRGLGWNFFVTVEVGALWYCTASHAVQPLLTDPCLSEGTEVLNVKLYRLWVCVTCHHYKGNKLRTMKCSSK